jgi:hypothetical protein
MNISDIKARVDALCTITSECPTIEQQSALYHGTIGVMHALYGPDSSQERTLQAAVERFGGLRSASAGPHSGSPFIVDYSVNAITGVLRAIKAELDSGFLGSLRVTLTGEVLTDFVKLARTTLEQSGDGAKNVAAVLTAAAFENVIRRLAELKGLPHQEKLVAPQLTVVATPSFNQAFECL